MAFDAGTIKATLKLQADKFGAELKKAQSKVGNFGKSLVSIKGLIGVTFGALAIRQVVEFGRAIFLRADKDKIKKRLRELGVV